MKITIVLPDFGDSGTRRSLLTLAKGFSRRGCMVDLVVTRNEGPYKNFVPPGVKVINLNVNNVSPKWLQRPLSLRPLVSYFRKNRPDVVLPVFDYFEAVVSLALQRAFPTKKRPLFVYSIHNDINFLKDFTIPKRFAIRLLKTFVLHRADIVVAVSRGVANSWATYFKLPKDRIKVIYNPVDIDKIKGLAEEKVDHPWLSPGHPPLVLGIGSLSSQKDFCTLIEAFAQVVKKRDARLVILGEGEERPKIEKLVKALDLSSAVDLPGFAQNPFAYLKQASLFVLSSRYEGFPNVLVEALALGVPIVSTDCPHGPREILENGQYGLLVPVGDPDALADAMLHTLNSPIPSEILRRRAEEFSVDKVVDTWLSLFDQGFNI
jgi:glycosyltransferase involved in cell wall biosynthesis